MISLCFVVEVENREISLHKFFSYEDALDFVCWRVASILGLSLEEVTAKYLNPVTPMEDGEICDTVAWCNHKGQYDWKIYVPGDY